MLTHFSKQNSRLLTFTNPYLLIRPIVILAELFAGTPTVGWAIISTFVKSLALEVFLDEVT